MTDEKIEKIRAIAAAALARFDAVVDWLGIGGGKMQGPEYLALNPTRTDAKPGSFTINRNTGHWGDFATGDKGGDLVSLAAYLRSEKQGAAAVALAGFLGIDAGGLQTRPPAHEREAGKGHVSPAPKKPASGPDSASGGDTCIMPAPDDAPAPPASHARHGKPSHRWAYLAADGRVNFYHDRYEPKAAGERKQFAPLTLWRTADGRLEWRFKAPPEPRPPYGLPALATRSGPAVLAEGEKAADAAAILLPDSPVLTFQGGAQAIGKGDYSAFAGREVWLWADADDPGDKAMQTAAARLIAAGAGPVKRFDLACFAATPGIDAEGAAILTEAEPLATGDDAADLLARGWTADHLRLILTRPDALIPCAAPAAKVGAGGTAGAAGAKPKEAGNGGEASGRRFELTDKGVLYYEPDKAPRWVCSWLNVPARVRNPAGGGWGKLVEFADPDRKPKRRVLPDALLSGDGTELERIMRDEGLHIAPSGKALLRQYLIEAAPKARARVTNRIGWHDAGPEGAVYVLPDAPAIGRAGEEWLCESEGGAASTFAQRGTLKGWQEEIAACCVGNSRLAFSVSVAFAAPLLYLTGGEGGGFHFRSSSSDGKTTALRVAASVCGGHDYMRRWRATDNAIEAIALQHCDAPLLLDEIAQTDPKAAGEIAYMLANGSGKIRAGRTGAAREVVQWRVLFLSAGEIGLAEHMSEGGKIMRAGQSLRMAEIPADAGAGLGIFENLHGHAGGAAFAKALADACRRNFGGVFLAYLGELVKRQHEIADTVVAALKVFEAACLTSDAHGQARRAADRFALVGAAGELATSWGLTGWPQGEAMQAARRCYEGWLSARGGSGDHESGSMLAQVRRFLEAHGEARFVDWNRPATKDDHAPRVMNRCGYRRYDEVDGPHWYVFPESFKAEICKGHDPKAVAALLHQRGYLDVQTAQKGRSCYVARHRLPGEGQRWVYHILPAIMDGGGDEGGGEQ